jgi:hypothetical protein
MLGVFTAALALLTFGCVSSNGTPKRHPSPSSTPRPVADSSPYWCDFIPQQAFSEITGIHGYSHEHRDGWSASGGECLVYSAASTPPLGVSWADDGPQVVRRQESLYASLGPTLLPAPLGLGFTVNAPDPLSGRPYYTIAAFRCGKMTPWIRFDLMQITQGRNETNDMISLMKIAEQRFGVLHNCTPRPLDGA